MGAVFDALGSSTRRRILDIVKSRPGCTVGEVARHFDTTRVAVMRHIRMLAEADLLISRKDGRKRCLYHNAVPIQAIYDRWTGELSAFWAGRMLDVKYQVEKKDKRSQDARNPEVRGQGRHQGPRRGRVA